MKNSPLIKLENVSLEYELHHERSTTLKEFLVTTLNRKRKVKGSSSFLALNSINLTFGVGERVGIVGLNGAGKSTLLKVISGIYKPSSGVVLVSGNIQPLIEIAAGFNPEFTGRENIYLNGYMLGFTKKQIVEKEEEIIEFADLGTFIDTPIKYYSSGMSVRLAFTIATMIEPEILVFDELLSAGDAVFMRKAQARMQKLLDFAKIMVLVSHDLNSIRSLCNRLIVLDKGAVKFDGSVEQGITCYEQANV